MKVKRDGATLRGPGIGDDCRGLAVLVAVAREMKKANVQPQGTITFVADVGEEGLGDLARHEAAVQRDAEGSIDRFVSIDGTGIHVTNVAVGSHRYRVTFKGPGGHSFGAFGMANPIGAMGRAIAKIEDMQVPKQPKTTFNVGRVGGGTSVNSIPFEGWMEVDMRSSDAASLAAVDAMFQKAVDTAVAEENQRWGRGTITVVKELVGDRPAGSTPENSAIVRTGLATATALGFNANLGEGSTDSNLPMSLKIPAITVGGGGRGSNAHALNESFDTTDAWMGTQYAMLARCRACSLMGRKGGKGRRGRKGWILVTIMIALAAAAWLTRTRDRRPDLRTIPNQNVLLITIDTLRADALGSYGGVAATPALDRSCRRGRPVRLRARPRGGDADVAREHPDRRAPVSSRSSRQFRVPATARRAHRRHDPQGRRLRNRSVRRRISAALTLRPDQRFRDLRRSIRGDARAN